MNTLIAFRCSEADKTRLQAISDEQVCHVSDLIRKAVKEIIASNEQNGGVR